jgi:hypothetical protein
MFANPSQANEENGASGVFHVAAQLPTLVLKLSTCQLVAIPGNQPLILESP